MKKLILSLFFIFTLILIPQVFADFEQIPQIQPNALASYNHETNQVNVTWDFNKLPDNTKCLLKGDVRYNENLNNDYGLEDYIPSFTPRFYSPTTSTPILLEAVNEFSPENQYAEEVSCTGSTRIDIDTLMNHSENINNYPDMQLFLTFYVADGNGDFNAFGKYRIDEVFIMYTPTSVLNQSAKDYGCDGQIGNILYIDSTGSHWNHGDRCDLYVPIPSNRWVDFDPSFSELRKQIVTGLHDTTYPLLIKVGSEPTEQPTKKKNGGGCNDCDPPWIGTNSKGKIVVDKGIIINGKSFDAGYFHKDNPMQNTMINETNIISANYRENGSPANIKLVQLAMVKELGTAFGEAEAIIEVWMEYFANDMDNPKIKEIKVIDKNNILNDDVEAFVSLENCQDNDKPDTKNCLKTTFVYSYAKVPQGIVLLFEAIDYKNNGFQTFFNSGFNVTDPSPKVIVPEEPQKEKECKIKMVPNRVHSCQFLPLVEYEIKRAEKTYKDLYNPEIVYDYAK